MSTSSNRVPRASTSSPAPESPMEVLYNTAVQSFVRRDHIKTQASLARLLDLLKREAHPSGSGSSDSFLWYELDQPGGGPEESEWTIKTLKLFISSHASLYTDPPQNKTALSSSVQQMLPPASPAALLEHLRTVCDTTYYPDSTAPTSAQLLPPPLISTLLLASLKLRPSEPALSFAHHLAEDWLSLLPDSFILDISPQSESNQTSSAPLSPEMNKRTEGAREGYLKVVELFVGEVLAREGEWDMARGFLDGEVVMPSKRKESLFRHLRAMQSKPRSSNTSSPASSRVLPPLDTSGYLPSKSSSPALGTNAHSGSQGSRSRSSTASSTSSSSEATARPNGIVPSGLARGQSSLAPPSSSRDKGKGKAVAESTKGAKGGRDIFQDIRDAVSDATDSTFALPRRIFVNPSNPDSPKRNSPLPAKRPTSTYTSILDLIPPSIRARLSSPYLLSMALPVPIILIFMILGIRRRLRRARGRVPQVVSAGTAIAANSAVDTVRERLRRARVGGGLMGWVAWYLRWWLDKFKGVWKLGTTITWM